MSPADWVSELDPAPPAELATAMRNSLGGATRSPSAEELLQATERVLERVLRTDCEARASALDLLTLDALMTHALLVAARDPRTPANFADQALARISAVWQ